MTVLDIGPSCGSLYPDNVAAAERSLVALALYDPAAALSVNLPSRTFFDPRFQRVWEAATGVFERTGTADSVTVADALQATGYLSAIGGLAFLSKLVVDGFSGAVPTLASVHAEIVRTAYTTRDLRRLASEIPGALDAGAGLPEVFDRVRTFIDAVEGGESACTDLATEVDAINVNLEEVQARRASGDFVQKGLVTGLGLEQYVPGGIPVDKLTMLFGETGTFKTAAKQWIADQVALSGRYVLDFSIEDSAELTAQRFMARHSGIPYGRIVTGDVSDDEAKLLADLTPRVREAASRIIVVGNVPNTIDEAVRLSRYWGRKVDLAAVFLDYVQIMEIGNATNEAQELYRICITAQRAAHRDKVAWVLLSQMNRKFESRDDKRPQLGDLYGSSAMGQCAKLAVGIYRPSKYAPQPAPDSPWHGWYNNAPGAPQLYKGAVELWIRKNVLGESDVMLPVLVDLPTGRFSRVTL